MKFKLIFLLIVIFLNINVYAQKKVRKPYECGRYFLSIEEMVNDPKIKIYLDHVNFKAGNVIADIGSENGYIPAALSIYNDSLCFYLEDINPHCLNQTEFNKVLNYYSILNGRLITNNFILKLGEQNNPDLPKDTFDKIMLNDVIHQVIYPDSFLKNLNALLKPSGYLYVGQYDNNGLSLTCLIYLVENNGFSVKAIYHETNYNLFVFEKTKFIKQEPDNIFIAAVTGNIPSLKKFIWEEKEDIDKMDESGFTPLMYASRYNQFDAVKFLIENNANINIVGSIYKSTAFLYAVRNNHSEITKYLIDHGAITNITFDGISALMIAAENGNIELVNLMINNRADINYEFERKNVVFYAVESGNFELVRYFYKLGIIKPKMKDSEGRNLLFYAATGTNLEIVKYLIEKAGFKPNIKDKWGCNPLCYAWKPEIIDYLKISKK